MRKIKERFKFLLWVWAARENYDNFISLVENMNKYPKKYVFTRFDLWLCNKVAARYDRVISQIYIPISGRNISIFWEPKVKIKQKEKNSI